MKQITVGICGLGLIGGSIAARLRQCGSRYFVVGLDKKSIRDSAKRLRVVDVSCDDVATVFDMSDVIILAAPLAENAKLLRRLAKHSSNRTPLIMDCGSMQAPIARVAKNVTWQSNAAFIAGHPMAGSEKSGLMNRDPQLFKGKLLFVDSSVALVSAHQIQMHRLVRDLGMRLTPINNEKHDRLMTCLSQVPQIVSTALGVYWSSLTKSEIALAGSGARSMIRLAKSPHSMWGPIVDANSVGLTSSLGALIKILQKAQRDVRSKKGLAPMFTKAQKVAQCL